MTVRAISEFSFIHLARTGNLAEVQRRLTRAVTVGRRNFVRVFARAKNLFNLDDTLDNYWPAGDQALDLAAAAGVRTLLSLGQDTTGMSWDEFVTFVMACVDRWGHRPDMTLQLFNEPGLRDQAIVSGADDPDLLRLADRVADRLGHRDFLIGDVLDDDNPDASADIVARYVTIAKHANILNRHPSRKGDAQPDGDRFRRWIDHQEGSYDIVSEARKVNSDAWMWIDEAMGFAGSPVVAGHVRETDPEAAVAGEATALAAECGWCFHYISEQDDNVEACLAQLGPVTEQFPADPSYAYHNDSWQGSATRGFTPGGKMRSLVNGRDGVVLGDGTVKPSPTWANGYGPDGQLFNGAHVDIWHVS
ncbi:MAG TPA: hypothetical protein VHP62_01800 [Usitatibacter sp.]|jgi:hypothetical protein|nr:hypothetical protein [Usitatibacter sp.]